MDEKGIVLLDRDGVICVEKHLLHRKEEFELLPRVGEAIKLLNDNYWKVAVVTNQPVVARGLCSEEDVKEIHNYMRDLLGKEGALLDSVYYCPHHPTVGNNPNYTKECECRKPGIGMFLQAKKDFGLESLKNSYMAGDRTADIKAGNIAGCKTILLKTGYGGNDGFNDAAPMFEAEDLYEAVVKIILQKR